MEDNEKNVRTSIKQDLNQERNILDYARRGVLANKLNATSRPNIGLLTTAIEEEWN